MATRGTVRMACRADGSNVGQEIPALLVDGLAVHKSHSSRKGYTITHRKTGLAIEQGVARRRDALEIAGCMATRFDWSFEKLADLSPAQRDKAKFVHASAVVDVNPRGSK